MTVHVFGLSHDRASVAVREAFALSDAARADVLASLPEGVEVVLLSTCNRLEAVVHGSDADVRIVRLALASAAGRAWPRAQAFQRTDEAAIRHVFELASGLRSLVLGDAQILHQVKEAYRASVEADAVGPVLHRLFHAAFRAAKRVRTETALAEGAATVSAAAVAAARQHLRADGHEGLDGSRILLLGAGEMGVAALRALASDHPADLAVANRSGARAEAAARRSGARVLDWDDRYRAAAAADVVLVATGATDPVLTARELAQGPRLPRLILDVAVPRNVDRAVDALDGVTVLDLDHFGARVDETDAHRRASVPAARAICDETLADFVAWYFHQQALQPTIRSLRATFDAIRQREVERNAHRFSDADREELDRLTQSIMQKVLAVPVVRLKGEGPDSFDFVRGVEALGRIFARPGCDDAEADELAARAAADRFEDARRGAPEATRAVDREGQCPVRAGSSDA